LDAARAKHCSNPHEILIVCIGISVDIDDHRLVAAWIQIAAILEDAIVKGVG
jgi:hypothetical protein